VARFIVFDSDPAGLACHEPGNLERGGVWNWMLNERADGSIIVIPAIVDYEVRRSLISNDLWDSVKRLDALYSAKYVRHLSISDEALRTAAKLWAEVRRRGEPTAHDHALDGDVILSAQAMEYCSDADDWQVITENVAHIARYVGDRARSRRAVVGQWLNSKRSILEP
jgi:toxin FitB